MHKDYLVGTLGIVKVQATQDGSRPVILSARQEAQGACRLPLSAGCHRAGSTSAGFLRANNELCRSLSMHGCPFAAVTCQTSPPTFARYASAKTERSATIRPARTAQAIVKPPICRRRRVA